MGIREVKEELKSMATKHQNMEHELLAKQSYGTDDKVGVRWGDVGALLGFPRKRKGCTRVPY